MIGRPGSAAVLVAAAMLAAPSLARAQEAPVDPPEQGQTEAGPADSPERAQQDAPADSTDRAQTQDEPADAASTQSSAQPGAGADEAASDAQGRDAERGNAAEQGDDVPYMVECGPDPDTGERVCLVDRATYVGWRTFHSVCHTCHAQDAVGSTFAPDLLARMRQIDKAQFLMSVDQGYTGQVGVMPAWGENPNVNKYYEELWSYLRARADGALPPGRPKRMPD